MSDYAQFFCDLLVMSCKWMPNFISLSLKLQEIDLYRQRKINENNLEKWLRPLNFIYSVETNDTRPHAKNQLKRKIFSIFYWFFSRAENRPNLFFAGCLVLCKSLAVALVTPEKLQKIKDNMTHRLTRQSKSRADILNIWNLNLTMRHCLN